MILLKKLKIVYDITKEVKKVTDKLIFDKLTPNVRAIGEIAKSAMSAGAYGLVAINTVGPGYYLVDGHPVLTNKVGGLSGKGIIPIGIKCVRDIAEKLGKVPIIGMGGIAVAKDVETYANAGASFFGIGSVLAGMTEGEIKNYFSTLVGDLNTGKNNAAALVKEVDMEYRKVRIKEKIDYGCDFKVFRTNEQINAEPGQFVFAWLPRIGEKPFSIMDDNPLTLGILEKGEFTRKINSLKRGDLFYIRGPYGKPVNIDFKRPVILVGGGCGIVGLYLIAKKARNTNLTILLGAKDKQHIPYLSEFRKYGKVYVATEDGSYGTRAMVTDLFEKANLESVSQFYNCGSINMVKTVLPLEQKLSRKEDIHSSMDYMTRCGVGICGSCADEKGRRTCVEGPFMNI